MKKDPARRESLYEVQMTTHVIATSEEEAIQKLKKSPDLSDHIEFCSTATYIVDAKAINLGAVYLAKMWAIGLFSTNIGTNPEQAVRDYLELMTFRFEDDEQWELLYSWIYPAAEKIYATQYQERKETL